MFSTKKPAFVLSLWKDYGVVKKEEKMEPIQTQARQKLNRVNRGYLFAKNNLPETITPYLQFSAKAKADGALSGKTKELILLGIALATRCNGCLLHHMKECKKLGVTREEILETFGVAVMMGGGPVFTFAAELEEAMEEFYPPEKAKENKNPA